MCIIIAIFYRWRSWGLECSNKNPTAVRQDPNLGAPEFRAYSYDPSIASVMSNSKDNSSPNPNAWVFSPTLLSNSPIPTACPTIQPSSNTIYLKIVSYLTNEGFSPITLSILQLQTPITNPGCSTGCRLEVFMTPFMGLINLLNQLKNSGKLAKLLVYY